MAHQERNEEQTPGKARRCRGLITEASERRLDDAAGDVALLQGQDQERHRREVEDEADRSRPGAERPVPDEHSEQ